MLPPPRCCAAHTGNTEDFYNFSVDKPCTFRIPTGGRGKIAAAETLVPNCLEIGCRYARCHGAGKVNGDFYELTLPPAHQAFARLASGVAKWNRL